MAPVEPWERVWIDAETYDGDIHSLINCTECHLGQSVDDMELAHEGMVSSPTADAERTCGSCHPKITEASMNSLHTTLAGYDNAVYERSLPEDHPTIEHMESYHCNDCHATCGDCHVSQPASSGGGLLEGHLFVEEPSMSRNCTACHGSRVKDEYYGAHEGLPSDVHFRARMSCVDCHTGDEMHGMNMDAAHRYDGAPEPSCESCHEDQVGVGSGIYQHEVHGTETMSCQTCHSVGYTQCTNCHVERTEDSDIPFYSVESHELDFAIAKNILRSADRPWDYTLVRHVPIDIDSFSFYGDNLLANFDARPTWAYATPHNIQRNTPQTESCLTCHSNDDIFLTEAKVVPEEWEANRVIMLDEAPPLPDGYVDVITGQEDAAPAAETDSGSGSDDGGFWGSDGGDEAEEPAADDDAGGFWGSDGGDEAEEPAADDDAGDFWGSDGGDEAEEPAADDDAGDFWGSDGGDEAEEPAADDDADSFWGG